MNGRKSKSVNLGKNEANVHAYPILFVRGVSFVIHRPMDA